MDPSPRTSPPTGAKPPSSFKRVVGASLAGTTLEWYDHFIYGSAAALVFPKLFFPDDDPLTATLLSLATYSVAFVTRPLGAAIFGHLGDKRGRKSILVVTLLVMGIATTLVGLLPTYAQIGAAAPMLLVVLRFLQGIGLGGEWGGAALMVGEHSSGGRRGFFGALMQMGSPLGLLVANGVFSLVTYLVSDDAFFSWGWRVPFLLSLLLVMTGLWIRARIHESPLFEEESRHTDAVAPLSEVLTRHWRKVALAVGSRIGSDVAFYVYNVLVLVYGTTQLHLDRQLLLSSVLLGAVAQALSIPVWGHLADRMGRRPVLIAGALGAAVWTFVFFPMLDSSSPGWVVLAPVVGNVFIAAMWGPLAAYVPELFPTRVRYTGAGLGFQIAGVFGGALAPIISTYLVAHFHSWVPVAVYLGVLLALLVACVLAARETANSDLRSLDEQKSEPAAAPVAGAGSTPSR
ncbi:MFS transporter [Streptomyces sp. NPDC056309]|uniref:MFS transporter n=1 Tax=unclassified Streptomyces TaxID=2593676 RepID=UPI0035D938CA